MEKLYIVSRVFEETNPYYDYNRQNNGGGYSQPHIELLLSDNRKVVIDDTSCGDFGTHYVVVLFNGNVKEAVCARDVEINGAGDYVRNEFASSFDEVRHSDIIALIESEEGYRVASAQQCAAWDAEEEAACLEEDEADTPKAENGDIAKFAVNRHGSEELEYFVSIEDAKCFIAAKLGEFQHVYEDTEGWAHKPVFAASGYNDQDEDGYVANATYSVIEM